ncbi:putative L-type lectin-domain containing receptor kinase S.7 [Dichanthelium oligosanthes]|uniref:non-specific serine/threonine protein kinase n=1 Tax=Dichanthelium oligosanthes TaxID=888268 RepID=A0A1E5UYZ2_9POAL|nr:putative L-type lectin-domain containing receptor kinase S.7 [Dichanthelium oligosanthes]
MALTLSRILCRCYSLIIILFVHARLAASVSFNFDFATSDYASELNYSNDSYWAKPVVELTKDQRYDSMINSVGRVWYAQPVQLWDPATRALASFNTTFSFQIKSGNDSRTPADGMAFFLSCYPSVTPHYSDGGTLGLITGPFSNLTASGDERFVAVEFDTHSNAAWESGNHVGIDVNSMASVASKDTDLPGRNLSSGLPMKATVTYRNDTMVMSVDLHIGDAAYHVSANVDLRQNLPETVAVGMSAATGSLFEVHQLLSWSFTSDLGADKKPPPPAAAPDQTHDDGAKGPSKHRVGPEVLALAIVSGFLCLVVLLLIACRFKMVSRWCQRHAGEKLGHGPRRYQYLELVKATNKFDQKRKLGRGGSSEVYLGEDDQGRRVAVKKLISIGATYADARRRRREFEAEVDIISRLRHKNLVRLFGWCDSSNGLLLVYELISQGSLDKYLYSNETERSLTWDDRYRIIIGLVKALGYLHGEHSGTKYVVHGDIKPSNIMLDEDFNAKLGDFGLARLLDYRAKARTTENVMGTQGYIEPEFVETGKRSMESDVYSFGIVLLEMVTGLGPLRRPLRSWVWELYGQNNVLEAASPTLRSETNDQQMERVLVVGLWCTQPVRKERPSIAHAMRVLEHADAELPVLPPSRGHVTLLGGLSESPEHRRDAWPFLGKLSLVPSQMYSNTAPAAIAGEQGCGNADRSHSIEQGSSIIIE